MSAGPVAASRGSALELASALVKLARPRDWLKSVFVLMPLPFALASGGAFSAASLVLGIAGMALASSAVYALNDARDAERDRLSARTRQRPIAAGRISRRAALLAALVWLALAAFLLAETGIPAATLIVTAYVALNLLYSFGGKHVPLVDVALISSGYVLRVVLGCALVGVPPSNWLLLCSSALALLIALGKRRGELVTAGDGPQRPVLAAYTRTYLDQAMGIVAGVTLFGYALYCMETPLLLPGREIASLPFVVFGVLEYLRLVQVRGDGESPVELLLRSPGLLVAGAGWVAASLWSVGLERLL